MADNATMASLTTATTETITTTITGAVTGAAAQRSAAVIKVKLTISERFTVDISHDSLVMRFSRIKDVAAGNTEPSLRQLHCLYYSTPHTPLPPSHAA